MAIPRSWVFFDCESCPDTFDPHGRAQHYFRCAVAIHVGETAGGKRIRQVFRTADANELWDWIVTRLTRRATTWIVAHNASYDLSISGFWSRLAEGMWTFANMSRPGRRGGDGKPRRVCAIGPGPFVLELQSATGLRATVLDSRNWYRMRLAELGKLTGLHKRTMPSHEAIDLEWLAYCERDVEIVEAAMLDAAELVHEESLGDFSYTVSSQAKRAWVSRYGGHRDALHNDPKIQALERESYYCGEFRANYIGRIPMHPDGGAAHLYDQPTMPDGRPAGPVDQLDVRGLYPSVMIGRGYPDRLVDYRESPHGWSPIGVGTMADCIADVDLDAERRDWPVRVNGETWHCVGRLRTVLAGPELSEAISCGAVRRIYRCARYRLSPCLDAFALGLCHLREVALRQGDPLAARLLKDLANGLHGKLGERQPLWVDMPDFVPPKPYETGLGVDEATGETFAYRAIGWNAQRHAGRAETETSRIAVASFVASYARQRMRELLAHCPPRSIYYLAADGIVCSRGATQALERAGELAEDVIGKFRRVETYNSAEINGIHDYRLGTRRVIGWGGRAPVERDASQVITQRVESLGEQWSRPLDGTVHWRPEIRRRSKGSLRWVLGLDGWTEPVWLDMSDQGSSASDSSAPASANANSSIADSTVLP